MNPLSIIKYGTYFSVSKFKSWFNVFGSKLSFVKKILVLYYCMMDDETPKYVKAIIVGALGYLILPVDAVPDAIAGLGWLDDLAVITFATNMAGKFIKNSHREKAQTLFPFGDNRA